MYASFCEDASGRLHQFSTLQSDASVWCMAKDLQDVALLAKIEGGDLIALEAKYHLSCLATLRIATGHMLEKLSITLLINLLKRKKWKQELLLSLQHILRAQ